MSYGFSTICTPKPRARSPARRQRDHHRDASFYAITYRSKPSMSENDGLFLCEPQADTHSEDEAQDTCNLNPKQLMVVAALAEGSTEAEAARLVGVNRTTIYRWHQNADFVAELNRRKREIL